MVLSVGNRGSAAVNSGPVADNFGSINQGEDDFEAAPSGTKFTAPQTPHRTSLPAKESDIQKFIKAGTHSQINEILRNFEKVSKFPGITKENLDFARKSTLDRLTEVTKPEDFGVLMRAKQLIMGE